MFYLATYTFPDEVKELDAYSIALGNGQLFVGDEDALCWASMEIENWYIQQADYSNGYQSSLNLDKSEHHKRIYDFSDADGKVFAIVCIHEISPV